MPVGEGLGISALPHAEAQMKKRINVVTHAERRRVRGGSRKLRPFRRGKGESAARAGADAHDDDDDERKECLG